MPDVEVGQPARGLGLGLHNASSEHGTAHEIRTLHSADRFRWAATRSTGGSRTDQSRPPPLSLRDGSGAAADAQIISSSRRLGGGTVSEHRGSPRVLGLVTTGLIIGAVEVVLAISFASLVFGGYLYYYLADGIGLYLVAGALTLAIVAWRAGKRGAVGSIQDAAAAVLALLAFRTALDTHGSPDRAFLTVVAATLVVTVLTGITFLVIGAFKLGNLIRLVPYPVVGGFLAGTGWLLVKGGIQVATGIPPTVSSFHFLTGGFELLRWVPAVVFGAFMLWMTRVVKRPLVIPAVILGGLVLFAIGMLVT